MALRLIPAILLLVFLLAGPARAEDPAQIDLGRWSEADLAQLMTQAQRFPDPGARIAAISGHFLATPYVADTLIGSPQTPERLVIDLAGVDCFTFLDLVEALRRATGPAELPARLRQVRYRDGQVAYTSRRHFFSDWVAGAGGRVADVTAAVGKGRARTVVKQLNQKGDGGLWLPGIPVVRREIAYIPEGLIDREVLAALRPGDYIGIYSDRAGLDVSHVGLVVPGPNGVLLRHASSLASIRRVVDVDLQTYLQGKPGLVVYRAH